MERFMNAAVAVANRLVREAIWQGNRCAWMGDDLEPVGGAWQVVHRSVDRYLYSGTSGVALFLAGMASVTGDARLAETATAALRRSVGDAATTQDPAALSLYGGTLGVAWAAALAGRWIGSDELLTTAASVADDVCSALASPVTLGYDVISGDAGTALALLGLSRSLDRPEMVEAAVAAGERLAGRAEHNSLGAHWRDTSGGALCGLAHGASGAALALSELAPVAARAEFGELAANALRWERAWFERSAPGWPDLRSPSSIEAIGPQPDGTAAAERASVIAGLAADQGSYPGFWCHGTVGIGLVRLRVYALTGSEVALAEAGAALAAARETAAAATRTGSFDSNLSLCHGLSGTVELLLAAYELFSDNAYLAAARSIGDYGLSRVATEHQWPCGVPGGGETPGLMTGLAGIGTTLLRLYDPALAPSLALPNAVSDDYFTVGYQRSPS